MATRLIQIADSPCTCNRSCNHCISNIIEDLESIDDGTEKLQYIAELAKEIPCLKDEYKKDNFKVQGCMSNLWVVPEIKDGKCYFHSDGDAIIPKGIAFIVSALHSGYTPEEVLSLDLECLKDLGLERFLSPNRRNSVSNLSSTIHEFAKQYIESKHCENCKLAQNA